MAGGWRESRVQRAAIAVLAAASVTVIAAIGRSLRWRVEGLDHLAFEGDRKRSIMAFWHSRIMPATYYFRRRRILVMISENFSGEWIARVIDRFGYESARGSSASRGARALRQMTEGLAAGQVVGLAVDGPNGPAREVQPGVVWLAKLSGHPIVPFHFEASRAWEFKTWDRTWVPAPFATVALLVAPPIAVAPDANEEAMETARLQVAKALADLEARAQALLH